MGGHFRWEPTDGRKVPVVADRRQSGQCRAAEASPTVPPMSAGRLLNLRMDPDGGDPYICSAGTIGYSEETLLEKWARDSKIMDIFEGTQQIQQLVVARRLLGL